MKNINKTLSLFAALAFSLAVALGFSQVQAQTGGVVTAVTPTAYWKYCIRYPFSRFCPKKTPTPTPTATATASPTATATPTPTPTATATPSYTPTPSVLRDTLGQWGGTAPTVNQYGNMDSEGQGGNPLTGQSPAFLVNVPGTQSFRVTSVELNIGGLGTGQNIEINWGVDHQAYITVHSDTTYASNNFVSGNIVPLTAISAPSSVVNLGFDSNAWTWRYHVTYGSLPQSIVLPPGSSVFTLFFERLSPPNCCIIEAYETTFSGSPDWILNRWQTVPPTGSALGTWYGGFAYSGVLSVKISGYYL